MANKPKLDYTIAFRIESSLGTFYEQLAEKDYRDVNDYVRMLLKKLSESGTVSIPTTLEQHQKQERQG